MKVKRKINKLNQIDYFFGGIHILAARNNNLIFLYKLNGELVSIMRYADEHKNIPFPKLFLLCQNLIQKYYSKAFFV